MRPGEDIALHRVRGSLNVTFPVIGGRSGVHRNVALGINDRDLPAFDIGERVFGQQSIEHLLRGESLAQQYEPARTVPSIHRRLRRHRADTRFRPGHVVADCKHARRDRNTEITGNGIERNDGKGGGRRSGTEQDNEQRSQNFHGFS